MQPSSPDEFRHSWYTIIREVAQGILTTVFEAVSTNPKRCHLRIALKVLRSRHDTPLFMRVAQVNAGLDHPRIPPLHEVGECSSGPYMVQQLIEGEDLQDDIGHAGRNPGDVARIIAEVAGALDYAHGRGLVHGYVHPRHLLLGRDGSAWLIGFGEYAPGRALQLGHSVHLAPEQLEAGGEITTRTDVFTLSETAFWLLSGCHPFQGFRSKELQAAKRDGGLERRIRRQGREISPGIEAVLRRGMAPRPEDRFASSGEFAAALTTAVTTADGGKKSWWQYWR